MYIRMSLSLSIYFCRFLCIFVRVDVLLIDMYRGVHKYKIQKGIYIYIYMYIHMYGCVLMHYHMCVRIHRYLCMHACEHVWMYRVYVDFASHPRTGKAVHVNELEDEEFNHGSPPWSQLLGRVGLVLRTRLRLKGAGHFMRSWPVLLTVPKVLVLCLVGSIIRPLLTHSFNVWTGFPMLRGSGESASS